MTLRTAFAFVFLVAACKDTPPPAACGDLGPPACPEDNGADVCGDPTCATIYACQNASWVYVASCPNYNPEAGVHIPEASTEASAEFDADFDAPPGAYGGPGCVDLESPDCDVGTGIACADSPGCCDCQDLYVCDNGNWIPWGECTDGGVVHTAK